MAGSQCILGLGTCLPPLCCSSKQPKSSSRVGISRKGPKKIEGSHQVREQKLEKHNAGSGFSTPRQRTAMHGSNSQSDFGKALKDNALKNAHHSHHVEFSPSKENRVSASPSVDSSVSGSGFSASGSYASTRASSNGISSLEFKRQTGITIRPTTAPASLQSMSTSSVRTTADSSSLMPWTTSSSPGGVGAHTPNSTVPHWKGLGNAVDESKPGNKPREFRDNNLETKSGREHSPPGKPTFRGQPRSRSRPSWNPSTVPSYEKQSDMYSSFENQWSIPHDGRHRSIGRASKKVRFE